MALTKIDDRGLTTPIDLLDNEKIRFGTGNDLEIHHNGTDTYISHTGSGVFRIEGNGSNTIALRAKTGENSLTLNPDGAVELYYNNSKKFETITSGVRISSGDLELLDNTGSTGRLLLGNGADLQIYHDGSNSIINDAGTGSLRIAHAGTNNWEFGDGFLKGNDGRKIILGDGSDLEIHHDGSDSFIKDTGTGNLFIATSGLRVRNAANSENLIQADENYGVRLYFDDVKKLETASDKVIFYGHAKVDSDNAYDLGASGARWKDLYLSGGLFVGGTGSANELDDYEEGTWTIGMDYHTGAGWANVGFDTAMTNTTGYYVKIGKIVNVRIYTSAFDVNSTAATNYARITGLPFTSRAGIGSYSVMSFTHGTSFTNDATTGYTELSNNTVRPTQPGLTTSDTWKDGTVYMMMSGTYEVA